MKGVGRVKGLKEGSETSDDESRCEERGKVEWVGRKADR